MPLKRSSSLAMPFARGRKGDSGKKGVVITSCSTEDWAATLAMLSNMPRAHYTSRHRNSNSESGASRSKSRSSSGSKNLDGYEAPSSDIPRRNSSGSTRDSFSPTRTSFNPSKSSFSPTRISGSPKKHSGSPIKQQQPHHKQAPSRNPSASKSTSREVHVKALGELQTAAARLPHPEVVYGAMIPEPDYSDDERETSVTKQAALVTRNNQVNASSPVRREEKLAVGSGRVDDKGLIMPKKLVNPCLESTEKKSLHKELLYNQKRGVNLLNQKSELQKAMEKHNDKKVLKEIKKEKEAALTPFQKALDERAQKIEQMEKAENKDPESEKATCEFQKIHAKVRAKMEVQ